MGRLIQQLEDQEDLIDVLEAELDIATGRSEVERLSKEEIVEWSGNAVLA